MSEEFQEPTSMNVDQAADQILQSIADQAPEDDQEELEAEEVDTEVTDETAADETEETETEEDSAETEDEEELFYELDGEEVSVSQIKEWREGGLKSKDYTQKTQKLSEERREVESERIAIQQERQAIQAERAQLQEALTAMAIDGEPEPNWVELAGALPPQEYQAKQAEWQQKQAQKQQAANAYQALQQQQMQETQQRELASLLSAKPDWADPQKGDAAMTAITTAAAPYGFTPDEIRGISDHRMLLVLDALASQGQQLSKVAEAKDAVSKRVVKAQPRRSPGVKSSKGQAESKALKKQRAKFNKTRSVDDAVGTILAQINS